MKLKNCHLNRADGLIDVFNIFVLIIAYPLYDWLKFWYDGVSAKWIFSFSSIPEESHISVYRIRRLINKQKL